MKVTAERFEFVDYKLQNNRDILLEYSTIFSDNSRLNFTEKYTLPQPVGSDTNPSIIESILSTLHLMSGLSYWKLYCTPHIVLKKTHINKDQASFWNTVYMKGLGEFYYRNKIDFRGLVNFPYSETLSQDEIRVSLSDKALIGIGGGKDSLVTFELLKKNIIPATGFILETQKGYDLINKVVDKMGIDAIRVKRQIDTQLFEANQVEGAFNGHIPITSIYSVVGVLCALLYDFKYVVMSNEKSADYGNVEYMGAEINHQWSKSSEFEAIFQDYINKNITPDIKYFSLLRPWTEMRIVEEFVNYPGYFQTFSSCNANFKVNNKLGLDSKYWCGKCPKCAFVFAMLSAYLPKVELLTIFGKNLYDDVELIPLYKELLGVKDFKPFECVGTPEEVKAAFYLASKKNEFNEDAVMRMFEKKVLPAIDDPEGLDKNILQSGVGAEIPVKFKKLVES